MLPATVKAHRRDRGRMRNQGGKPRVVVTVRERDGNSVPAVSIRKGGLLHSVAVCTRTETVVHADEAVSRDDPHERFEVERISRQAAYRLDGACVDVAAKHFRRAQAGIHGHVAGPHFFRYAQEFSWRTQAKRSPALKLSDI
jgi:hypothetical protein